MKRKLIGQGAGGLTICLPKGWTETNHLKRGDEVNLDEEDNRLIVSGTGLGEKKAATIKINTGTPDKIVGFLISNAYKRGYDTLHVQFEDKKSLPVIEKITSALMGYELIDIEERRVTIRNVSVELEGEYAGLLRKSFFLCKENMRKILEDIKNQNYARGHEIREYRELVTRYTHFCKRVIYKNKKHDDMFMFEFLIVRDLEKISNELHYIYLYLDRFRPRVDSKTARYVMMAFTMVDELLSSYFRKDVGYLSRFITEKDKFMFDELDRLLMDKKLNHNLLLRVANIVRRCSDISGPFYVKYL